MDYAIGCRSVVMKRLLKLFVFNSCIEDWNYMFFKKKLKNEPRLIDVVTKKMDTGYVFWNISDDLAHSVNEIMASTPMVIMSYAYARRSAAAALYIQGLFNEDAFNHAESMFKALQQRTGHTVDFQKRAASESSEFLQSYHYAVTTMFEKKAVQIAREYEITSRRLSDAELFAEVIDTVYEEQKQLESDAEQSAANQLQNLLFRNVSKGVEANAARRDAGDTNVKDDIISKLLEISNRETKKSTTIAIMPLKPGGHWSYQIHCSDEEKSAVHELLDKLWSATEGNVTMTALRYHGGTDS